MTVSGTPAPALAFQHFKEGTARRTEHLNAGRCVDRLSVCGGSALGNDLQMKRHRVGVGVDLDNGDLSAVIVDVLVERDQPRFVRLDEINETGHSLLLGGELPWLEMVGRDEDEWA